MNSEEKLLIKQFEDRARPVERVAHIDNNEIIKVLKEIRAELKKLNSGD